MPLTYIDYFVVTESYFSYFASAHAAKHIFTLARSLCMHISAYTYIIDMNSIPLHLPHEVSCLWQPACKSLLEIKYLCQEYVFLCNTVQLLLQDVVSTKTKSLHCHALYCHSAALSLLLTLTCWCLAGKFTLFAMFVYHVYHAANIC